MRHNIVEFAIDLWQSCMGILRVQKRGSILLRIYFRFHKSKDQFLKTRVQFSTLVCSLCSANVLTTVEIGLLQD